MISDTVTLITLMNVYPYPVILPKKVNKRSYTVFKNNPKITQKCITDFLRIFNLEIDIARFARNETF